MEIASVSDLANVPCFLVGRRRHGVFFPWQSPFSHPVPSCTLDFLCSSLPPGQSILLFSRHTQSHVCCGIYHTQRAQQSLPGCCLWPQPGRQRPLRGNMVQGPQVSRLGSAGCILAVKVSTNLRKVFSAGRRPLLWPSCC